MRSWVHRAIALIEADFQRSADTHLIKLDLPALPDIDFYLKDESTHPTGSLKHRLARSLFLYGLCNGQIDEGTVVVEASSGSTAVSEAYFARLLGLRFIAVMPRQTSREKIEQIRFYHGECHLIDHPDLYGEAERLARELGGHYIDQFTYAERATDWRGNNNIADAIYDQMSCERYPEPEWLVMTAGTGGTSATLGRYLRYRRHAGRLCVADPENSVFLEAFESGDRGVTSDRPSRIEGIGRPRVEPSFLPSVIDRMMRVPDAASIATLHFLEGLLNRRVGGSTGTNVFAAFRLVSEMREQGVEGSVVTLICDGGERYRHSYYNEDWLQQQGLEPGPWLQRLQAFQRTGRLEMPEQETTTGEDR